MITATYFGEITELNSRAVWYSDEESDADDEDEIEPRFPMKLRPPVGMKSHESIRSSVIHSATFKRLKPTPPGLKITSCIISLSSGSQYKNFNLSDPSMLLVGIFGELGKVVLCPLIDSSRNSSPGECSLWLIFDSSDPIISGQEVAYFVESLREQIYSVLNVEPNSSIVILSQQFSKTEHLEYLSNLQSPLIKSPFKGRALIPPALIKNQFESALFEQFTLTLKLAYVVCLPDPKNFWFDKTLNWPSIASQIIELKLNDDNLEKTLIFT